MKCLAGEWFIWISVMYRQCFNPRFSCHQLLIIIDNCRLTVSCTTALIVNDGISLEEEPLCLQPRGEAPALAVSEYPAVLCNESTVGESGRAATTRVTTVPLIQSLLPSQGINAALCKLQEIEGIESKTCHELCL